MKSKWVISYFLTLYYSWYIIFVTASQPRSMVGTQFTCVCVCVSYVCSCSAHALCLTKFSKLLSIFVPPPLPATPTAISIDVGQTAHKIIDTVSFRTQDLTLGPSLFGWCRTALADRFCLWWARICIRSARTVHQLKYVAWIIMRSICGNYRYQQVWY